MSDQPLQSLSRRDLLRLGTAALGTWFLPSAWTEAMAAAEANQDGPVTSLDQLAPFQPNQLAGPKPDLPKRLAVGLPDDNAFWREFTGAMRAPAEAGGLSLTEAVAHLNSGKNIEQLQQFLSLGVSALMVVDIDIQAQKSVQLSAIDKGICTFTLSHGPGTCQIAAHQPDIGRQQADRVLNYVNQNLASKANVVYFNLDWNQALKPRHDAFLDQFRKQAKPDTKLVADLNANPGTMEEGFKLTNTVLQAHPEANVFVGDDMIVLGSLAALEAAGKASKPDIAIIGMAGDSAALAQIEKGSGPYKSTATFNFPILGYMVGKFASDWIEGKSIPSVIKAPAVELSTPEDIVAYRRDLIDLSGTFAKGEGKYFTLLGNISYGMKNRYFDGNV
jgi:ribose transport system substrate-binding protein